MSKEIIVQDREELIYLLCEAAEFEHTVMCTYLYAAWSLKREADDSCTTQELEAVERWRGALRKVALEEMLHLTLVNNLLASLGAARHLSRPNFPVPAGRFPADVVFSLRPFCEASMEHFVFIERPEGIDMQDGAGFDHVEHYERVARPELLTPTPQDYASQGHLYHGIARALHDLVQRHGEEGVFVGHGDSQVASAEFRLPGLFKITDLASAVRAIEEIVVQGEGAPAHSEDSHYAVFHEVHQELVAMKSARPEFEPAFRTLPDPVLVQLDESETQRFVSEPSARRVVDLGDALYGLMMRTFAQVFSPSPLPRPLRQGLANAATELMYALSAIGELATRLPSGVSEGPHTGKNAGLTLVLPRSAGQLVQSCAAQILAERTSELAETARGLASELPLNPVIDRLDSLALRLNGLHEEFEAHITLSVNTLLATGPAVQATDDGTSELELDPNDPNVAKTKDVTLRFDTKRCIHSRRCVLGAPQVFLANVQGPWLHPETTSVEHIAQLAHACPSGAITYQRHDGGSGEAAPEVNVVRIRGATLCRCGKSKNKPFCDNSHREAGFVATGEPETIPSEPLEQRGGQLRVDPLHNGPLQVTGNLEICAGTGRTVSRVENCRLCRCGGSKTKPFCDNTHVQIGFKSDE
jgi:CDGSH-type Zn-finger protein